MEEKEEKKRIFILTSAQPSGRTILLIRRTQLNPLNPEEVRLAEMTEDMYNVSTDAESDSLEFVECGNCF